MRVAILMTNTDESAFAQRHPKDGQKFTQLLSLARPDWQYSIYSVKDGVFPAALDDFDAALITGSPASVRDDADWIAQLEELVRQALGAGKPLFGACFGHQLIAQALGGRVDFNQAGFIVGAIQATWPNAGQVATYAFHKEQVVALPKDARVMSAGPNCPFAGFAIGETVLTTQYHPEMDATFVAALLDEFGGDLGDGVAECARMTLSTPVNMTAWAERIAAFFEGP